MTTIEIIKYHHKHDSNMIVKMVADIIHASCITDILFLTLSQPYHLSHGLYRNKFQFNMSKVTAYYRNKFQFKTSKVTAYYFAQHLSSIDF